MLYEVDVSGTFDATVAVEAASPEEAREKLADKYLGCYEDFDLVEWSSFGATIDDVNGIEEATEKEDG